MTAVAVIDLVTDARRYDVRDVAVTPFSGSASPKPADQAGCPSSAMAMDSAGARCCCIHALTARRMLMVSTVLVGDACVAPARGMTSSTANASRLTVALVTTILSRLGAMLPTRLQGDSRTGAKV